VSIIADSADEAIAMALGIRYDGLQRRLDGPPLRQFTDPQTRGTFYAEVDGDVQPALWRMRAKFRAEARKREAAA
jgi:hypothetical protein